MRWSDARQGDSQPSFRPALVLEIPPTAFMSVLLLLMCNAELPRSAHVIPIALGHRRLAPLSANKSAAMLATLAEVGVFMEKSQ